MPETNKLPVEGLEAAKDGRKKSRKPKKPRDKTFGCLDWVEDVVIPMGERGAKLWRHLKATHRVGEPAQNMRMLKLDWDKFSPHVESWK